MKELNFEESFERLEELLEQMNSGDLALDQLLKDYEEADGLIRNCQKQLKNAEQKIEILLKNRNQELQCDEVGQPKTAAFDPTLEAETPM